MTKIKAYGAAPQSSGSGAKGTVDNPYTQAEYEDMLDKDTWPGGYVEGLGYCGKAVIVTASYPDSGSMDSMGSDDSWPSEETPENPWDSSDDNKNHDDSSAGNRPGQGGNPGGEYTGGGSGHGGNTGSSSNNTLLLDGHTEVSSYSQGIFRSLKGYYGTIKVTSTLRSPEKQAELMFKNTKEHGVASQLALYGKYGDAVINAFNPYASDEENLRAMTAEVYKQGPRNVSKHCMTLEDYKKLNVIDISRTQMTNPDKFVEEIRTTYKDIKYFNELKNGCTVILMLAVIYALPALSKREMNTDNLGLSDILLYCYHYAGHDAYPDMLPEDSYMELHVRNGMVTKGFFWSTTDEFDRGREGYECGFFVQPMKDIKAEADSISFLLTQEEGADGEKVNTFVKAPVDLHVRTWEKSLEIYRPWENFNPGMADSIRFSFGISRQWPDSILVRRWTRCDMEERMFVLKKR